MASSVFYRFKSQKEPSRVTFDGTGISVFELKRAIIEMSNLGDGSDFELTLSSSDGNGAYSDDTEIIPRSTIVIARRQPAARPGRGGAARYMWGKPSMSSKNVARGDATNVNNDRQNEIDASAAASAISELQSEKQREEAILKLGADMWKHQQKEMATAAPVRTGYKAKTTAASNTGSLPPDWYVCNRCGIKGHWIKDCPQNGNPDFDDNRRIKKSIGIPRSRLEIIDRKTITGSDGNVDSSKLPAGAMIDGDGNYVTVKPDKATWNKFQEKASKSAAAQAEEARGSRELQDRGLECPIDKKLFVVPTKTSCCQATYCNECITNALLDDDLRCPNCGTEGVLVDDLMPDDEMAAKIEQYMRDQEITDTLRLRGSDAISLGKPEIRDNEESSSALDPATNRSNGQLHDGTSQSSAPVHRSRSPKEGSNRKRKAENELESDRKSPNIGPGMSIVNPPRESRDTNIAQLERQPPRGPRALTQNTTAGQTPMMNAGYGFPAGMSGTANPMMEMNAMMWDPSMMFNPLAVMNQMYSVPNAQQSAMTTGPADQFSQRRTAPPGRGRGSHHNYRGSTQQPYRTFNASRPNPEENAYFRTPVNPHRHQTRRNAPRPTDYREI